MRSSTKRSATSSVLAVRLCTLTCAPCAKTMPLALTRMMLACWPAACVIAPAMRLGLASWIRLSVVNAAPATAAPPGASTCRNCSSALRPRLNCCQLRIARLPTWSTCMRCAWIACACACPCETKFWAATGSWAAASPPAAAQTAAAASAASRGPRRARRLPLAGLPWLRADSAAGTSAPRRALWTRRWQWRFMAGSRQGG